MPPPWRTKILTLHVNNKRTGQEVRRKIGSGYKVFYNSRNWKRNRIAVAVYKKLPEKVGEQNFRLAYENLSWYNLLHTSAGLPRQWEWPILRKFWRAPAINLSRGATAAWWSPEFPWSMREGYKHHGKQGIGVRNDDGFCSLDCVEAHDLIIYDTFFKKRLTQLVYQCRTLYADWLLATMSTHPETGFQCKSHPIWPYQPPNQILTLDRQKDPGRWAKVWSTQTEWIKWWKFNDRKNFHTPLEH